MVLTIAVVLNSEVTWAAPVLIAVICPTLVNLSSSEVASELSVENVELSSSDADTFKRRNDMRIIALIRYHILMI